MLLDTRALVLYICSREGTVPTLQKKEGGKIMTTTMTIKVNATLKRIREYADLVTELNAENYKKHDFTFEAPPVASIEHGRRFARIVLTAGTTGKGVHSFVEYTTGDIHKASGYKAPAKNGVRGNIFADDLGKSVIDWHGARYIERSMTSTIKPRRTPTYMTA